HPAIGRTPAVELAPDSDLGERLVTTSVGALAAGEVAEALDRGLAVAEDFRSRGLIAAAALFLAGEGRVCGSVAERPALLDTPLWPAGPLPLKGGDRPHLQRRSSCNDGGVAQRAGQPISPLEREMAGRPEGGLVERRLPKKPTNYEETPHA
ncbi:MAG: hypothetical protein ACK4U0_22040, partial [Mesorhizobium sp.]